MKKRSLGFKLITGGIIIVLIPLLIVGLFSITKSSRALNDISNAQVTTVAKGLADAVNMVLLEKVNIAQALALDSAVVDVATNVLRHGENEAGNDIEKVSIVLSNAMKIFGKDYEVIDITDAAGVVYVDGIGGAHKGINVSNRQYFKDSKKGNAIIGHVVKSKKTGNPVIPICIPLHSPSGEFAGTLLCIMKTDFLVGLIKDIKLGESGYAYMIDQDAMCIAHPDKKLILNVNQKNLKGMEIITEKMLASQTGAESYTFKGAEKIAGFAPIKLTGWSVNATQNAEEFLAPSHSIRNFIMVVGSIFMVLTILTILYFTRGITRPINRAVVMLNDAADHVSVSSSQVAAASHSLAEGSAQSASAIEETSSSLEEMASMTRQNAANANQADILMTDANQVVEKANHSMAELITSMEDISKASEETSKIIKTIDEIAFQTNLLALNAAVEAARAGEAGAGFAVVADEVRNLAMRAADAAQNTADLIEGTVKKVKDGAALVTKTNQEFSAVASSSVKVGGLVGEISAASSEQAQGIEHASNAIIEMEKVTQHNAANAEESAAASEEMSGQAGQMKEIAAELLQTIGGNLDGVRNVNGKTHARGGRKIDVPAKAKAITASNVVVPDQIIPLEEGEFKDF